MSSKHRNINGSPEKETWRNSRDNNDYEVILNKKDSALFETIGEYMKGRLDLEEVRNDTSLKIIDNDVKKLISDYSTKVVGNEDNEKYIRDSFKGIKTEKEILEEIDDIKRQTQTTNVNEISAEWVKEWHEKSQKNLGKDPKTEEIRNFITNSLKPDKVEPKLSLILKEGKKFTRSLMVRYISLSAAAVIGVFILLKTLLPSSDPENLFKSYYKPFNYVSSVTRDVVVHVQDDFSVAVEQYRIGDYYSAAIGFSNIIMKDTSFVAPRFLIGIIHLELGEYDKAINMLSSIKSPANEYYKETLWYLGLAYLKTGKKEKVADCFEILSQSPGFYNDRAKKILRRLK